MAPFDPNSREAAANAEMAATRLGRGAAVALLAGFLLILASGPALELAGAARGHSEIFKKLDLRDPEAPAETSPLHAIRRGIDEIEERFDERSQLVERTRPFIQQALTGWLGYGNERALVGHGRWLFFRDDVDHLLDERRASGFAGDPLATLVDFRDQLAGRSIALLVVPVPVKPAIEPQMLGARRALSPLRRPGERELLARLSARGVAVLDLADRFARDAALRPLYLETDTHWRPEAMEVAAREIAIRLRQMSDLPPGDPSLYREEVTPFTGEGELVPMLDLPPWSHLYPPETVTLRRVERRTRAPEGSPVASVLLLGDSFSQVYDGPRWGTRASLVDRLAYELGLPVDAIRESGGGATATRRRLARELAGDPARLEGVRAVVFEFVTRELSHGTWERIQLPRSR